MKWFDSFGDHEAIIDEKQFKILTKKLKLPKLAPAYGGVEFLDKTFGSKSDALSIVKEENNEYRVTARTDKVKALVNKALGIKESAVESFSKWYSAQDIDEALTAAQRLKRKMAFKKNAGKIARGKARSAKRTATPEQIKTRAMAQARAKMVAKILGGKSKSDLSLSDRSALEKKLDKKKGAIAKLAKKLKPIVKAKDKAKKAAAKAEDK